MKKEQIIGPLNRGDGAAEGPTRTSRQSAAPQSQAHGRYYEPAARGQLYSLALTATTTAVATGNIVGGGGANAPTQFALINPLNSGKNLVLLKFGMGVISGTPGVGGLFHGYIPNASTITAASPGGTIRSNLLGAAGNSVAIPWTSAGGSNLTGGGAPVVFKWADFSATGTAQAIANGHVRAIEEIAGSIVIPPNMVWLPLWGALGTSLLNGYSITWEEVPV